MTTKKIHPYIFIILSFLVGILVGTSLLALPISSTSGKSFGFVDSLFMATSAVCVTGLSVMNVSVEMTIFGKIIMAILMEFGGLSFLTIAVFFFTIIGGKIGVSNRFLLKEALNQSSVKGIVALVRKIIFISFGIQTIGVIVNIFALLKYVDYNFWSALGYSIFHTIAAFNNAGFDIFGSNSMIPFNNDVFINSTTMLLIVLGGVGFVVLEDIVKCKSFKKLKLHSKIVLISTFTLILLGAFLLKISLNNITWLEAFFTSITCRTAGFSTIDMSNLAPAGYFVIIILMFIGASPCSTGGGIKTTTFAIIFLSIVYFARGKKTKAFERSISNAVIVKAFILTTVGIICCLVTTILVSIIQPELGTRETLFEVISAFSTTGLSMGITSSLNSANKIILCLMMFFGRIGPLTIIGVVNKSWMVESKENVKYIEESVIIG
ncbi:MAG: hypothetical protein MR357_06485 [Anaeroplasma sp.]|nr:hypothetical protein [Anaeroplasma sp.]